MKLVDVDDEKKEKQNPKQSEAWQEPPVFDAKNTEKDSIGIGNFANGSNVAKFVLMTKTLHFAENTTMHGLRYIFMRNISRARRFLWVLIVLAGLGYWYYIVSQNIKSFLDYPTSTKINTVFEKKSQLPAVTICNFNMLARSKLTFEEDAIVSHVFTGLELPANVSLSDYENVDLEKFFIDKSPNYSTEYCIHKQLPCNSSLFSFHLTDYGRCLTFDPGLDENTKYQTLQGSMGGFYFAGLFLESDWTRTLFYAEEGFRIKIHESGTLPMTLASGSFSVVPSVISEIAITRHEITLLSSPYGDCGSKPLNYFKSYSKESCIFECRTKHTIKLCGCKLFYMPGDEKTCSWEKMQICNFLLYFPPNDSFLFDVTDCDCPHDCRITQYNYHITHSKPSVGYIEIAQNDAGIDIGEAAALKVFYQDLQYLEDIEEPVYSIEKLLCDVGGAAGLFLGCSFITVVEFFDFILEFGWLWMSKTALLRKKSRSKINVLK